VRLVLDTNIAVSALLWRGTPSRLVALANEGRCRLYTSVALLDELADVLSRKKLARAVVRTGSTASQLHSDYKRLANRVRSDALPERVARDADDDAVLACALAARAELIVSGDVHLLELGAFRTIPIVRAAEAVRRIGVRAAWTERGGLAQRDSVGAREIN
jgi:putative PIN family toxin of toxin-antitoxin system